MNKFVIIGPNGAGKGTQANLLCRLYDLVHISVGDILRWHIHRHTRLGARIHRAVGTGQLLSDELVTEVVHFRLDQHNWRYGFVLDGFPRSLGQAEFFIERYDMDAVIHIEVPEEVASTRMLSRRVCDRCGLDYNLIFHRPKLADTCDVCSGRLKSRADDTPGAIRQHLGDYNLKTIPILDLFREKERVISVNGDRPVDQVHANIRRELEMIDALRLEPLRGAA